MLGDLIKSLHLRSRFVFGPNITQNRSLMLNIFLLPSIHITFIIIWLRFLLTNSMVLYLLNLSMYRRYSYSCGMYLKTLYGYGSNNRVNCKASRNINIAKAFVEFLFKSTTFTLYDFIKFWFLCYFLVFSSIQKKKKK